jgi:hypothetical protein
VVERGGLENRCASDGTQGSNPCPSASCPREMRLPIPLRPVFPLFSRVMRAGLLTCPGTRGPIAFSPGRYSPDLLTAPIQ